MRFDTPYNQRTTPPHHGQQDQAAPAQPTGSRAWNSWWSRRSSNVQTNTNEAARLGIDIGSKTIKLVTVDVDGNIVNSLYHRHRSDVRTSLAELLHSMIWRYGDRELPVAITGSAGIALADDLGIPFVQEVVATTNAVRTRIPQADCIIELGGEDAKITYLADPIEQRMNATCAGGTGDFIDGIAGMLGIRTREISRLALGSQRTYPIASRCAVFAQTDVRPLINAGASKADIAQSALEAVVRQTLGGLACGRPIKGTVVFLGGPLEHIPALTIAFRRALSLTQKTGIKPTDAHLFAAMGATETATNPPALMLTELERRVRQLAPLSDKAGCLPPLFENADEIAAFRARHGQAGRIPATGLRGAKGNLYLGLDAGSTTCKYALIDETGALVASDYRRVKGDVLETARAMVEGVRISLESRLYSLGTCNIAHATVTGYGEDLLRASLGFDSGVVETVAHLRAAQSLRPDASFVLDIGGQDMKALWIRDGVVVDAVLNEACSSGCGAFVQSSTKSLQLSREDFTRYAFEASNPIDLGAKCTVFMTSRVRHAQKTGASPGDIAAGIAYSVVNNVMTRIIGASHTLPLGDAVVVQGGTFKSDAVLRAFEKVAGVEVTRPAQAHLMGAYGAALIARDRAQAVQDARQSSLITLSEVKALSVSRRSDRCAGCGNACLVSIVDFGNGKRFFSGNRCERVHAALFGETVPTEKEESPPNLVALEQKLLGTFRNLEGSGARRHVRVGLLNALNAYEALPFWHTLFAQLGFSIVVPDDARVPHLAGKASETIPSESACHPAKLSHARYASLVEAGAHFVFMPRFERGTRCPVACGYANALADNVERDRLVSPILRAIRPRALVRSNDDVAALRRTIEMLIPQDNTLDEDEFQKALAQALDAQESFEASMAQATDRAFSWLDGDPSRRLAVIAGRPYHVDPLVIHHIDEELARLGFAVVPMMGLDGPLHGATGRKALWKPAKHLVKLVEFVANNPQVEIVALRSFGCLYDAVSIDEARDLALQIGRPFTELKIDDIADTAHIRIRLRTLAHTSAERMAASDPASTYEPIESLNALQSEAPTPDLCSTAKALVERALAQTRDGDAGRITVPVACRDCVTDALPFELKHLVGSIPAIEERPMVNPNEMPQLASPPEASRPKIGLVGNPLIVFDPQLNDHVADLVESLGWQPVYPDPVLIAVDDVRYLDQLERFRDAGITRVIYLQSFGCLKGHVQSRGSLHELQRLFPELTITVIDYDPESSALNRENRIRLALS